MRERVTIEQQIAKQDIKPSDGETPLRFRDVVAMHNALRGIGAKTLPSKEARIHLARCIRAIKPFVDDYKDERDNIQREHMPPMEQAEEGQAVAFTNPIGMNQKYADLDRYVVGIKLPKPITDVMLPVKSKDEPENEVSLASLTADLGPLYEISADDEPKKKEA